VSNRTVTADAAPMKSRTRATAARAEKRCEPWNRPEFTDPAPLPLPRPLPSQAPVYENTMREAGRKLTRSPCAGDLREAEAQDPGEGTVFEASARYGRSRSR